MRHTPLPRIASAVAALLLLGGCTGGSSTAPTGTDSRHTNSPSSSQQQPSAGQGSAMPAPVYDQVRNIYGGASKARLRIKVYPLQRVAGALLLTVDYSAENPEGVFGDGWFTRGGGVKGVFDDNSLIDTRHLVRYLPLQKATSKNASYSSESRMGTQDHAVTYRVGGFFPDPGPDTSALSLDLQMGGIVPAIPISNDTTPPAGLVSGLPGAPAATERNDLKVWPVETPRADAVTVHQDITAEVGGGTVAEGVGGAQGVVTVNADVLFAFDSAELSPKGAALVARAATILGTKADPGRPVQVIGYTDAKGGDSYNQQLSSARASSVTTALAKNAQASRLSLRPEGRGAKNPIAPNTTPAGEDNPAGRALNRRVEIWYTPRPAPATATTPVPTSSPSPAAAAPATDDEGAVKLPHVTLVNSWFDVTVHPAVRDGKLTLISFDLTPQQHDAWLASGLSRSSWQDIGAVEVTDPATHRVYFAAHNADKRDEVVGTYASWMYAGNTYRYSLYVAGLPQDVSTASVSLATLGTATVPVRG